MSASAPDASAGSADVSSAASTGPSLDDSIGELLGDYRTEAESPEPESTSAAGTTPAEPAPGTDTETASDPAAAGTGSATAASDGTTPDTPATPTETDPFAETTPATYMVNGQQRTSEDIRVFKEGGAVIRPEGLPNVLARLAERDQLSDRVRTRDTEYSTLAKVTEWTDQASGKTYTGPDAAIEMRIGNASLLAENKLLVGALTDPDMLHSILTTEQVPDGKGGLRERVIVDPAALEGLKRELSLQRRELEATIRDHYRGVLAEASKPAAAAIDFSAEAPKLIAAVASAAQLDASLLTPQDKALLAKHLPAHTKDGHASVEWQELVKDRIAMRVEQKASASKLVSTTAAATKEASARMAAAARGVKPVTKPAAPAAKPVSPNAERQSAEADMWDVMERSAAAAMRRHA